MSIEKLIFILLIVGSCANDLSTDRESENDQKTINRPIQTGDTVIKMTGQSSDTKKEEL